MPRGRFVSKEICIDKKVNSLSSPDCMLAFTWLIPHLDYNGLTYGDPAIVRSMVFPRRSDITVEQMEGYIQEWAEKDLIVLYEKCGELYIWFPNFPKHQVGLQKHKEAKSSIPTPDNFQTYDGVTPELVEHNIKLSKEEVKLSEGEGEYEENPTPFRALSLVFLEKTGLPEGSGGISKYTGAINEMLELGVTPEILSEAIDTLIEKGYTIYNPGSCVNTCRNIIVDRHKKPKKNEPKGMAAVKAELARLEAEDGK